MSNNEKIPSHKNNLPNLVEQVKEMIGEDKLAVFNGDAEQLAQTHTSPLKINRGDVAPSFSLPATDGDTVDLKELFERGPVVLTFYRGVWCPYCNLHLGLLQQILPEIKLLGANVLAISPMNIVSSKAMVDTNKLQFSVLSDTGNKVAQKYTEIFKNSDDAINAMTELGYDFFSFYDDKSAELPVAATFIISSEGKVVFAESEGGDYRQRTEPKQILDALTIVKEG